MGKKYVLLLVSIFLSFECIAQFSHVDLMKDITSPNFNYESVTYKKSIVKLYECKDSFGEIDTGDILITTTKVYDSQHRLIEYNKYHHWNQEKFLKKIWYSASGKVDSIYQKGIQNFYDNIFIYFQEFMKLPIVLWDYNDSEYDWYGPNSVKYIYDSNGKLSKIRFTDSAETNTVRFVRIFKYENSLLREISNYTSDGSLYDTYSLSYNSNNQPIEALHIDSKGHLKNKYTFLYHEKGKISEIHFYFEINGELTGHHRLTLNSSHTIIKKQTYFSQFGEGATTSWTYSLKGGKMVNRYTHNITGENEIVDTLAITYNSKGLIETVETLYDPELDISNRKYTYDQNGNWIKQVYYYNKIPQYILIRKIEY